MRLSIRHIPALDKALYGSNYDWQYKTINNGKIGQAFKGGRIPWPRGKMLGGSSSMNALYYVKNYKDYEIWENAGNPSWNIENVTYHYKKAESFQNEILNKNPYVKNIYGDHGPQILNRFNSTYRNIYDNVLESYGELGFSRVIDLNGKFSAPGMSGIATVIAASGQRYSTYQSYLLPVRHRKNFKIVINAFVLKLLINKNNRAYGIQVDVNGKRIQLFTTLEIIVAAGTINTPQLLMLSGIGPKDHLESKNISCKVNLPGVGKNLQDHILAGVPIYGDIPENRSEAERAYDVIRYLNNRTGYLAESSNTDILVFYGRNKSAIYPEFQSHLFILNKNDPSATRLFRNYDDAVRNSFIEHIENNALYLFSFNLLHPKSRGEILLNTSNPYDKPLIDANYFGNPIDLNMTGTGMRMLSEILNTKYFKSINAFVQRIKIPECDKYELATEDYWQCQAKNIATTVYHPVGTSKMGQNSRDCVVNNYLKVHGVLDLRVIDASIMPNITSGNTNAPTIMIAEMGADMIKTEYLKEKNIIHEVLNIRNFI